MASAAPTVAITTISWGAITDEITIFAAVVPTPSVGDVWAAFVSDGSKVARDFDPDGSVTVYNEVMFAVDPGFESVTYSFARGPNTESVRIPRAGDADVPVSSGSQLAAPSSASGGRITSPTSGFASRTGSSSSEATGTTRSSGDQGGNAKTSSSKTPIGPIVGGVVGGIVVLAALIFLVWFLLRRRKRKQQAQASTAQLATGPRHDDDKYPVEGHGFIAHNGVNPHHGFPEPKLPNSIPELPYNNTTIPVHHELDPSKGNTAVMGASELDMGPGNGETIRRKPVNVLELGGGAPGQGQNPTAWRHELGEDGRQDGGNGVLQEQHAQPNGSPYVEAQRRLEIEFLESEEARLRGRKELLRQQQQGAK